jgi:hypothetical protein
VICGCGEDLARERVKPLLVRGVAVCLSVCYKVTVKTVMSPFIHVLICVAYGYGLCTAGVSMRLYKLHLNLLWR